VNISGREEDINNQKTGLQTTIPFAHEDVI